MKNNNRSYRTLVVIALLVAIAGISVAFAALSQNLDITATGNVVVTDWNIKWTDANGEVISGSSNSSAGTASTLPVATLTISGIVLEKPTDKIRWTITAENLGDIDAKLENVTNLLTKTVTFHNEETSNLTADDIFVTLTKSSNDAITASDTLVAGDTETYSLTIEFNSDADEVPSHDIAIEISALFPWVQG